MLHFFGKRLAELHEKNRDERGFTLIELLVVVIIIGILAAIAIPTFLAQPERAWESAAESELRNMATAATSCSSANGGSYFTAGGIDCGAVGTLDNYGWNDDSNVNQTATATATVWSGTATHASDTTTYSFTTDEANALAGQVRCTANCP